jgi:hypothetical protein
MEGNICGRTLITGRSCNLSNCLLKLLQCISTTYGLLFNNEQSMQCTHHWLHVPTVGCSILHCTNTLQPRIIPSKKTCDESAELRFMRSVSLRFASRSNSSLDTGKLVLPFSSPTNMMKNRKVAGTLREGLEQTSRGSLPVVSFSPSPQHFTTFGWPPWWETCRIEDTIQSDCSTLREGKTSKDDRASYTDKICYYIHYKFLPPSLFVLFLWCESNQLITGGVPRLEIPRPYHRTYIGKLHFAIVNSINCIGAENYSLHQACPDLILPIVP